MSRHLRTRSLAVLTVAASLVATPTAVSAAPATTAAAPATTAAAPEGRPVTPVTTLALPNGFRPEGIAIGTEPTAYLGSLADGSIYAADLFTGAGRVISQGPGTQSVGMTVDRRGRLFVAGGSAGDARVVDTGTGAVLASYTLAPAETSFVNDVTLTRSGAYFTDSFNPVLYHLPFRGTGALPTQREVVRIPLTGDLVYQPEGINANGIAVAPDGRSLLIVQSNTGLLFRVDPDSGVTERVRVAAQPGGAPDQDVLLPNGDGLLVLGRRLFVVQNLLNTLAVLAIDRTGGRARVLEKVTDARFDVPTTVAAFAGMLYLPNARFGIEVTPDTEFTVVGIANPARPRR